MPSAPQACASCFSTSCCTTRCRPFVLLRRFMRYMPLRDVVHLIVKPFLGKKQGPTKNEVLSRAVEHQAMKDAAAEFTTLPDAGSS